jgi:hypothetical protein
MHMHACKCCCLQIFANRGARFLYMPVWSKEEELFAFNQLYSAHFTQLTQQRVEHLIGVYGSGSIRHVLAMPSQRAVEFDDEEFNQMRIEVDARKVGCITLWCVACMPGMTDGSSMPATAKVRCGMCYVCYACVAACQQGEPRGM